MKIRWMLDSAVMLLLCMADDILKEMATPGAGRREESLHSGKGPCILIRRF